MSELAGTPNSPDSGTVTPPPTGTPPAGTTPLAPSPASTPGQDDKASKALIGQAPPVEPIKAESLKFPDGIEVDKTLTEGLVAALNNQELKPEERAQALVDLPLKA